jgi:ankyrin repeat protein
VWRKAQIVQVLLDLARQGKGTTFHRDDESADDGAGADSSDGKDDGEAKYLNAPDRFGNTPLLLAVEENRDAMIQFLVAKGAGAHTTQRTPANPACLLTSVVCRAMLCRVWWRRHQS